MNPENQAAALSPARLFSQPSGTPTGSLPPCLPAALRHSSLGDYI
ncbi:hypothetical protein [Chitinophaga varians]|nr:hypothetical protein [Chitinophaga varians]